SDAQFDAWSRRLSAGLVLEEEQSPEEPCDVSEIERLLDDVDGELEYSDDEQ
ncbi:MAG: hypothetical protein HYV60_08725, partial [Planctomycetia bacterium]|nr:hypothetical protein [Planctomycetia bacterium]